MCWRSVSGKLRPRAGRTNTTANTASANWPALHCATRSSTPGGRGCSEDYHDGLERYQADGMPDAWPTTWAEDWWKPKNPRRDLVRAAALLIAEIERLDRAALKTPNANMRGATPEGGLPSRWTGSAAAGGERIKT